MLTNRRQFMTRSAIGGLGLMATPLIASDPAAGALNSKAAQPPLIATHARYYRYSPEAGPREEIAWINVDLGAVRPIDAIRLRSPSVGKLPQNHAPVDFCIDCSVDPAFYDARPVALWRAEHSADPKSALAHFPEKRTNAQFIRLEASVDTKRGDALLPSGPRAMEILSGGAALSVDVQRWNKVRRGMASRVSRGDRNI